MSSRGEAFILDHLLRLFLVDAQGRRRRIAHCADVQADFRQGGWRLVGGDRVFGPRFYGQSPDSSDLRLFADEEEICGSGEVGHYHLFFDPLVSCHVHLSRDLGGYQGMVPLPGHLSLVVGQGWRFVSFASAPPERTTSSEILVAPKGFSLVALTALAAYKSAALHPRQRLSPLARRP